ncbi:MAG: hypothetical protein NTW03_15505 [Verrucomicrobia bacterium]|nr:hypothetical protein [Verrucomicrobiota bacterium]
MDTTFMDSAYNQFAGLITKFSFDPPNFVIALGLEAGGNVMIGGSFTNLGGNHALEINDPYPSLTWDQVWTRQDKRTRFNVARLIGSWGSVTTTVTTTNSTNITITANPPQGPGNVQFLFDQYTTDKNAGTMAVTLERVNGRLGTMIGSVATTNRTALAGVDFVLTNATPVWGEHAYSVDYLQYAPVSVASNGLFDLPLSLIDNQAMDGDKTFDMGLGLPSGSITLGGETIPVGAALGRRSAQVTIVNNNFPHGTLLFSSPTYSVNENVGTAVVTVLRTNGSAGRISVDYSTADGTATAPADYTSTRGTLTFEAGVTSQSIRVHIVNDTLVEFDESIQIVLTNASGGATIGQASGTATNPATFTSAATLWIIDDDFLPGHLNFSSTNFMTNESAGVAQITVTRTGGTRNAVSVSCAAIKDLGATNPATPGTVCGGVVRP